MVQVTIPSQMNSSLICLTSNQSKPSKNMSGDIFLFKTLHCLFISLRENLSRWPMRFYKICLPPNYFSGSFWNSGGGGVHFRVFLLVFQGFFEFAIPSTWENYLLKYLQALFHRILSGHLAWSQDFIHKFVSILLPVWLSPSMFSVLVNFHSYIAT